MRKTRSRKRLTQIFPWLLPLRKKQRCFFFYAAMKLDGKRYARERGEDCLPYELYSTKCPMYNPDTGFDMAYQENKVFNLKLAAATIHRLLIKPGETFSFWQVARDADRKTPYKEGLVLIDGKLKTSYGGGLCQISNLLFQMFLHTPLTIVERRGHEEKDFPELSGDALLGVDATILEGWLDLKVRNDTASTFQILLDFDEENIMGEVRVNSDLGRRFQVVNGAPKYYRRGGKIYEEVDVLQCVILTETDALVGEKRLYTNCCKIGYPLPETVEIERNEFDEEEKLGAGTRA